jgi:gamma-glutamylputrescine oxidase
LTGPRTYYEATARPLPDFPSLKGAKRADVCIIGAGFTGLGAALNLAEAGYSVIAIEQGRVASGASGRNGGQIHTGLRKDQLYLERKFGHAQARMLWDIGQAAVTEMDLRLEKHRIDAERQEGLIYADHRGRFVDDTHRYVDHLRTHYAYDKAEKLGMDEIRSLVRSSDYEGGMIDRGGGHLHPLKYARGLAQTAAKAGADIHENTKALDIKPGKKARVVTPEGSVTADWVLVAGDSLMQGLIPEADARILPIASTIGVTKPLGKKLKQYLYTPMAVADSRFVVNYFRPTPDGRLFFGGGESYSTTYVADPASKVRTALRTVFPGLADTEFDYAWSGVVGVTATRLPMVRRLQPNVLMAAGYSGQGVALAPFAGKVMAEAVAGTMERFDVLSQLPVPPFPGGSTLRQPLLVLAMLWYALRDRL